MGRTVLLAVSIAGAGLACHRQDQPAPATNAAPMLEAARLDARSPLPLLPAMAVHQKQNMRGHLKAVEQVVTGLAAGDFAAVEAASKRIGLSPERQAMCERLAAGSPGFRSEALRFHRTADSIGEAARERNANGVLLALSHTLATCTSCHAAFKQEIVGEAAWRTLTASQPAGTMTGKEMPQGR